MARCPRSVSAPNPSSSTSTCGSTPRPPAPTTGWPTRSTTAWSSIGWPGSSRETSFLLLEALADTVARAVTELDPAVERVAVVVRKLEPPIAEDLGSVGVRVVHGRPGVDVSGS